MSLEHKHFSLLRLTPFKVLVLSLSLNLLQRQGTDFMVFSYITLQCCFVKMCFIVKVDYMVEII